MELKRKVVQSVLEDLFKTVDYDTFKHLKYGEEDGDVDAFPELSIDFIRGYYHLMWLNELADEAAKDCPNPDCICKDERE